MTTTYNTVFEDVQILRPLDVGEAVARLAREAAMSKELAVLAREVVRDVVDATVSLVHSDLSSIEAVESFVHQRIRYTPDPAGAELVFDPLEMLDLITERGGYAGDCDDMAAFTAALLTSLGFPCRTVLVAYSETLLPDYFEHIFVECWVASRSEWVGVDASTRGNTALMTRQIQKVRYFEV